MVLNEEVKAINFFVIDFGVQKKIYIEFYIVYWFKFYLSKGKCLDKILV